VQRSYEQTVAIKPILDLSLVPPAIELPSYFAPRLREKKYKKKEGKIT
jgi:hypothetical protein